MSAPIRSAKPIRPLNGYKYPHMMIFFDTESNIILDDNNEKHTLRLGVAIFIHIDDNIKIMHREVYYFNSSDQFWNYVESKTKRDTVLYIYAHNAKYDTLNVDVIAQLERLNYDVPYPTINNAFIVSASKGKKKIKIVDTFNYARTSVDAMGKKLGVEKINLDEYRSKTLKGDIDFNAIPDSVLFKYCERDVEVIEQFMLSLIRLLNMEYKGKKLGSLKYTTASIALDIYRHNFITIMIYYHENDEILKLERAAYRGGIVECFHLKKLPKQKYYLLDINSMYVYVMSKFKFPLYPILHSTIGTVEDLKYSTSTNYVIADVLLCVEDNHGRYGLKQDGKLIFPVGEYRVTLHQAELLEAISANIITHVFSYVVYYADTCLDEYAHYFSELKKNATNKTDYDLAKLLGNGLYGKFGMRKYLNDEYELDIDFIFSGLDEKEQEKLSKKQKEKIKEKRQPYITTSKGSYIGWGDKYVRTYTDDFIHVPRTNIALAGAVTAYARLLISGYFKQAGYDHIYYADTDSCMVDEIGFNNLKDVLDDKELGKLKCEFEFNGGTIKAPKNYTFKILKLLKSLKVKDITYTKNQQMDLNYTNGKKLNTIHQQNLKNILTSLQKSIILKRRDRSKGIPTGAVLENGKYIYWRFTTFKEYLKSDGDLKGRIKLSRKNTLNYTKGVGDSGRTQPFTMGYIYNEDLKCYQNQIMNP